MAPRRASADRVAQCAKCWPRASTRSRRRRWDFGGPKTGTAVAWSHPDGPALAGPRCEMVTHPVEPGWTRTTLREVRGTPRPQHATDRLEEAPSPSDERVAARPGSVSTKVMLASLVSMGMVGAGAVLLMHSLVAGDQSRSQQLGGAVRQAAAAPIANVTPSSATATRLPDGSSRTSTATQVTTLTASPNHPAPSPSRPRLKPPPRWHLYPFAVPTPLAAIPGRGVPTVHPPPERTSDANPYDEGPATTTTRADAPTPLQAEDVPLENPSGGRE